MDSDRRVREAEAKAASLQEAARAEAAALVRDAESRVKATEARAAEQLKEQLRHGHGARMLSHTVRHWQSRALWCAWQQWSGVCAHGARLSEGQVAFVRSLGLVVGRFEVRQVSRCLSCWRVFVASTRLSLEREGMGAQVESFERRLRVSRHLHGARMVMHVVRRWRGRVLWGSWQRWLQEVESAKAAVLALEASEEEARRAAEHASVLAARSLEESALRAEAAT